MKQRKPLREHVQFIHCYAPPLDSSFSFLLLAISQPEILVLRSIKWKFNCWNKIYFLAMGPQSRARPRYRTLGAKLACSWVQFIIFLVLSSCFHLGVPTCVPHTNKCHHSGETTASWKADLPVCFFFSIKTGTLTHSIGFNRLLCSPEWYFKYFSWYLNFLHCVTL